MDNLEYLKEVEKSIQKKYKKKLWRPFCKAINQYELVEPGDKIAVCISGGKDSMLMAKLFQELKRHNKFEFELVFLVMDPGYNETTRQMIIDNSKKLNIPVLTTIPLKPVFRTCFRGIFFTCPRGFPVAE